MIFHSPRFDVFFATCQPARKVASKPTSILEVVEDLWVLQVLAPIEINLMIDLTYMFLNVSEYVHVYTYIIHHDSLCIYVCMFLDMCIHMYHYVLYCLVGN